MGAKNTKKRDKGFHVRMDATSEKSPVDCDTNVENVFFTNNSTYFKEGNIKDSLVAFAEIMNPEFWELIRS